MWKQDFFIDTPAPANAVWPWLCDTRRWPEWNAGVAAIELHGEFRAGTRFTMTLPDGTRIDSLLTEVQDNCCFVDETRLEGLCVIVSHRLDPLAEGGTRIHYEIAVTGDGAAEAGQAISADFPEVLAALAARLA